MFWLKFLAVFRPNYKNTNEGSRGGGVGEIYNCISVLRSHLSSRIKIYT